MTAGRCQVLLTLAQRRELRTSSILSLQRICSCLPKGLDSLCTTATRERQIVVRERQMAG